LPSLSVHTLNERVILGRARMKEIDLTESLPTVVRRYTGERSIARCPIFLTLSNSLPKLPCEGNHMEELIGAVIDSVVSAAHSERPVRMAALQKPRMQDLENVLEYRPSCWIKLKLEVQSLEDSRATVRELPEKFGFRCQNEWVVEDSDSMLISYACGDEAIPGLLIWLKSHKGRHQYSLLIPVSARQS
jgi:hypothetical protein